MVKDINGFFYIIELTIKALHVVLICLNTCLFPQLDPYFFTSYKIQGIMCDDI